MENLKVIIYNDKDMIYREGFLSKFESTSNIIEERRIDGSRNTFIRGYTDIITCQHNGKKQYIELDPTTMKKILKYNKEVDIEKLNKEIESKKKEIKELDDKLKDRENRWEKVKQYIANIYDLELEEDYDDDDDWEFSDDWE